MHACMQTVLQIKFQAALHGIRCSEGSSGYSSQAGPEGKLSSYVRVPSSLEIPDTDSKSSPDTSYSDVSGVGRMIRVVGVLRMCARLGTVLFRERVSTCGDAFASAIQECIEEVTTLRLLHLSVP